MKKFYMTMAAMLCGVAAMAQNTLYVEDITVKPGETVDLPICLKNSDPVVSLQFVLNLPEGIVYSDDETEYTFNEDRLDVEYARELQNKPTWGAERFFVFQLVGNKIVFGPTAKASGKTFDGVFKSTVFLGNDGELIYVPITVGEEVAEGAYTCTLTQIALSSAVTDSKVPPVNVATSTESSFTLTVGDGTGINSINAADSKAPVYNVAGQRVSKAQKGVYIQNGKKVAVK